ncbi:MAG TPA: methyltransferase [Methylomirabilota bacterium]|nr:methyltransferase [Methylomirabilota bacterium]
MNPSSHDGFNEIHSNRDRLRDFLRAVSARSLPGIRAMATKFPWEGYRTLLDVGTAEGALPVEIARAHPHLSCAGFDLPACRPFFEAYVRTHGVSDRTRFIAGDFFKDPLPPADVITMGHILREWNLEKRRQLIAKSHAALPEGGSLVVREALLEEDRHRNAFALLIGMTPRPRTTGKFDCAAEDYRAWMEEAGFRETCVESLAGADSMVIGIK